MAMVAPDETAAGSGPGVDKSIQNQESAKLAQTFATIKLRAQPAMPEAIETLFSVDDVLPVS
jgi:hypothetical protein